MSASGSGGSVTAKSTASGAARTMRGTTSLYNDVFIYSGVLIEQLEAALRVVAIGGAARLLVDARRDENHAGTGEIAISAVPYLHLRREGRTATQIRRDRLGACG